MLIHALITAIRTSPEPTILLVLDRLDKVLADLVGGCAWVSVLAHHDTAQLLLVPVVHGIGLPGFLFRLTGVSVEILLRGLALNVHIVTELALAALLTTTLLVEHTQHGLGVNTERHLLDLDGLEELCCLLLGQLSGLLLGLTLGLLGCLLLFVGILVGCGLRIQLGNLFLGGSSFFLRGVVLVGWV